MAGFLNKLRKRSHGQQNTPASEPDEIITVYDNFGQEMHVTRQQWLREVLIPNLCKERSDSEKYYSLVAQAVRDGYARDIREHCGELHKIDGASVRSSLLLGIAHMEADCLDEAEFVLREAIEQHGENGYLFCNLAKVIDRGGDREAGESMLWHSLECDPNQENALGWYAAIQHERSGRQAMEEAYARVAELPGSWLARIWMGRFQLERGELDCAMDLYTEAFDIVGDDVPIIMLQQISGDLGNAGYISESLELVRPYFDAEAHGLQVGHNLVRACLALSRLEEAREVIGSLQAMHCPSWKEHLEMLERELHEKELEALPVDHGSHSSVSLLDFEGPLWMRLGSPFQDLLPARQPGCLRIAVIGSVVLQQIDATETQRQLTSDSGRLSRACPLFLSEWLTFATESEVHSIIPWMDAGGFAVLSSPWSGEQLRRLGQKSNDRFDFVITVAVEAFREPWNLVYEIYDTEQDKTIERGKQQFEFQAVGEGVQSFSTLVLKSIITKTDVRKRKLPAWLQYPSDLEFGDYLTRLEQQIVVASEHEESMPSGGMYGAREIMEGAIWLAVRNPQCVVTRILLSQTARHMMEAEPQIAREFIDQLRELLEIHPLSGELGCRVDSEIDKVILAGEVR